MHIVCFMSTNNFQQQRQHINRNERTQTIETESWRNLVAAFEFERSAERFDTRRRNNRNSSSGIGCEVDGGGGRRLMGTSVWLTVSNKAISLKVLKRFGCRKLFTHRM